MNFNLKQAIEVLERTPQTLDYFLVGLSDGWLQNNEGDTTWNATEVIEHLIQAEKTNWLPRLEMILQDGESKPFPPFDRFSHLHEASERSFAQKLQEFKTLRTENLVTWFSVLLT